MKYLMLAYTGAKQWDESTVSEEEIARICREYDAFERRLKASGEWVAAEGLADHSQTLTVAPGAKGAVVTDGPYIEAKEAMVSYVLVDVDREERAREIACELVELTGEVCELRPVMSMDIPPEA